MNLDKWVTEIAEWVAVGERKAEIIIDSADHTKCYIYDRRTGQDDAFRFPEPLPTAAEMHAKKVARLQKELARAEASIPKA